MLSVAQKKKKEKPFFKSTLLSRLHFLFTLNSSKNRECGERGDLVGGGREGSCAVSLQNRAPRGLCYRFLLSTSWFHVLLLFSFSCYEYVSVPTNSTEAEMKPRFVARSRA